VIGIGAWQFGGEWGHDFSQSEVDAILDEAARCGINLIDTAECYGDHLSERLIGDYLRRRDRSRWIIATKFGHEFLSFMKRNDDFSTAGARAQLEASLRALGIDSIDLYQFHSGPDSAFRNEGLWEALRTEKDAGKIGHLGISIASKGSAVQAAEARKAGAEVLQVVYNRLDRRPETDYFSHADRDRLGVLARVPLASGLLSGSYKPDATFAANDFRSTLGEEKVRRTVEEVEQIRRTEVPGGLPMAQWALAWCLRNATVSAVIPGCKSAEQVRSNAAAAELTSAGQN
jgi:aryl-alcohol dehydrogenase-like predicted oxidoreductase